MPSSPARAPQPTPATNEATRTEVPTVKPPAQVRSPAPANRVPASNPVPRQLTPTGGTAPAPGTAESEKHLAHPLETPEGNVTPPSYLYNPAPNYPDLARQRGWTGEVLVRVRVDAAGKVEAVTLERTSGYKILDQAALRQVRTWRFNPARKGPIAVPGEVAVPVRFTLDRS